MTDLGFPPKGPADMHCDNQSAINATNARVPTDRSRHIDIQHFAIQDWKEPGAIVMEFISGVINLSDDLTKPLGWALQDRHARRVRGALLSCVLFLFDLLKTSACVRSIACFLGGFCLVFGLSVRSPACCRICFDDPFCSHDPPQSCFPVACQRKTRLLCRCGALHHRRLGLDQDWIHQGRVSVVLRTTDRCTGPPRRA